MSPTSGSPEDRPVSLHEFLTQLYSDMDQESPEVSDLLKKRVNCYDRGDGSPTYQDQNLDEDSGPASQISSKPR